MPCDAMVQSHAIQKLHCDESLTILFADFINRADIRMIQGGGSTRLPTKSLQCLRIFGNAFGKEFECDEPAKLSVLGLVDDTHPTATQLFENAVMRDGLANHGLKS